MKFLCVIWDINPLQLWSNLAIADLRWNSAGLFSWLQCFIRFSFLSCLSKTRYFTCYECCTCSGTQTSQVQLMVAERLKVLLSLPCRNRCFLNIRCRSDDEFRFTLAKIFSKSNPKTWPFQRRWKDTSPTFNICVSVIPTWEDCAAEVILLYQKQRCGNWKRPKYPSSRLPSFQQELWGTNT